MPSAAPPEPSTAWSPPPPVLTLCAHEVHVWRAELDGGGETDVERLATTLAPDEVTALRALAPPARERAFFAVWTRKEAYAKARGLGLALPFEEFTVSTDPAAPTLLAAADDDPARWTLRDLDAGPGYAAALAI